MTLTTSAPAIVAGVADEADAPAVAAALARAFEHDPVAAWFTPSRPERRLERLEYAFESVYVRRLSLPHGCVYTTAEHAGAALWIPPDKVHLSAWENLRLLPAMARAWGRDLPRAMKGIAAMDAVHPHEPHYYLPIIGVDPAHQGRGIGSALLRPVLERCDAEGVGAYLEATTPLSRELYLRHGFLDVDVLELPDDGPPLWRMWRTPEAR